MASSRFLSSFRSLIGAIPRPRILPRHVSGYLTNVPKNYNPAGLPLSVRMWKQVLKRVGPYIFPDMERVIVEKESPDFVVFRLYMFGRDKEGVKLHVNNNTLTIDDPINAAFTGYCDLTGKHCDIHNTRAVMKNSLLKVVIPKLKKKEEGKKIIRDVNLNVESRF